MKKGSNDKMKLQDYLLTIFMEESSESIKAAGNIIKHGKNYRFPNYKGITAEELLYSEFGDCLANVILLNHIGISVAPLTAKVLLEMNGNVIKEIEFRVERTMIIIEKNIEYLEIDREEFYKFKEEVERDFSEAKKRLKETEKTSRKILLKTY